MTNYQRFLKRGGLVILPLVAVVGCGGAETSAPEAEMAEAADTSGHTGLY